MRSDPDHPPEPTLHERVVKRKRLRVHLPSPPPLSLLLSLLHETRTQILLCYVGLMTLFIGLAVPTIYQLLYQEVDQRVRRAVAAEIKEFQGVLQRTPPSNLPTLKELLDTHLKQQLISNDIYLITLLEGSFFQSSPSALPQVMKPGTPLMDRWQTTYAPLQGELIVPDPSIDSVLFAVEPVSINGIHLGALVVAHTTGGERREISQAARIVLGVMLSILLLALLLAWLMSSWVLRPLRDIVTVAREITESNLSQRIPPTGRGELGTIGAAFNGMLDRLQSAFTQQQVFINDASHELRTPITIIQGHLDLLGTVAPEQQEVVELVHDELARMNRLVHDLLLLAQTEQPNFHRPEWIHLTSFTEEVFQKGKMLALCPLKLAQVGVGKVRLDRHRITQAMMNLVENATQHTPPDGQITIGSDMSREHVCFWVSDTGRGIPLKEQSRIFARFARARSNPPPSKGSGLGLSIVEAIVQSAQGRVELYSIPGQGSTFLLILPIDTTHASLRTVSLSNRGVQL